MADKIQPSHIPLFNINDDSASVPSTPTTSTPNTSTISVQSKSSKSLIVSRLCRYHHKSPSLFDIKKPQSVALATTEEVFMGDLMLASEDSRGSEADLELSLVHLKTGNKVRINKILLKFIPLTQIPLIIPEVIDTGCLPALEYVWQKGPDLKTMGKTHNVFPIHYAAEHNQSELLIWMLNNTDKIGEKFDPEGNSFLHAACRSNSPELFRVCLDHLKKDEKVFSSLINHLNRDEGTPLFVATDFQFQTAVEMLLESGADPVGSIPSNMSPIHLAAQKGYMTMLHLMLRESEKKSIDLKKLFTHRVYTEKGEELNIVQIAAPQAISLLVQYGADPDSTRGEIHRTPLFQAVQDQDADLVRVLLQAKANPNTQDIGGSTPLMEAIVVGSNEVVALLLEAGGDPNLPNKAGFNSINTCAQYGHVEILDMLVRAGGILVGDNMFTSALHSAAFWDEAEILRVMLTKYKAPVNTLSKISTLPVHPAIRKGHTSCLRVLIEAGADISFKNPLTGDTLLHLAVRENQRESVRLLVKARAKQDDYDNANLTPLMLAVEINSHDLIPILFAAGASLHKRDMNGNNSLHIAAMHSSLRSAKCILDLLKTLRDANLDFMLFEDKNNKGLTPFDISLTTPKETVSRLFVEYGSSDYFLKSPDIAKLDPKRGKRFSIPFEDKSLPVNIFHRVMNKFCFKTMRTLQEKMVECQGSQSVTLTTSFLDFDEYGFLPKDERYNFRSKTILHKLLDCPETEVKYHPIVNIVVNNKISIYRNWYLFSFLLYVFYLILLSYALLQATTRCDPRQYIDAADYIRLLSEIFVLIYVIVAFMSEVVEFWVDWYNLIHEKNYSNGNMKSTILGEYSRISAKEKLFDLYNATDERASYFISAILSYFSDLYNFLDLSSILLVLLVFILRVSTSQSEWLFASLMYIANVFRMFKYIRIIPALGAYSVIIFRIFLIDMPKFLSVFAIIFVAFFGSAVLALRLSPDYLRPVENGTCSVGLSFFTHHNTSTFNDLLTSGVLLLVDGGASGHEDDFAFRVKWYFEVVYIVFAFIISVVLSNILIAQLTATYSQISVQNELHYKLELVVTLEHSSNIFFFCGSRPRKYCLVKQIQLPTQEWEDLNMYSYSKTTEELLYDVTENLQEFRQEVDKDMQINLKASSDLHIKVDNIEEMSSQCLNLVSEIVSEDVPLSQVIEAKLENLFSTTKSLGRPVSDVIDDKMKGLLAQSRTSTDQQLAYMKEFESRLEARFESLLTQIDSKLNAVEARLHTQH